MPVLSHGISKAIIVASEQANRAWEETKMNRIHAEPPSLVSFLLLAGAHEHSCCSSRDATGLKNWQRRNQREHGTYGQNEQVKGRESDSDGGVEKGIASKTWFDWNISQTNSLSLCLTVMRAPSEVVHSHMHKLTHKHRLGAFVNTSRLVLPQAPSTVPIVRAPPADGVTATVQWT